MKKGILIIAGVWIILNVASYLIWDTIGAVLSTYVCMGVVWFGRTKLIKWLRI